jgi:hypothetical protein
LKRNFDSEKRSFSIEKQKRSGERFSFTWNDRRTRRFSLYFKPLKTSSNAFTIAFSAAFSAASWNAFSYSCASRFLYSCS